MKTLVASPGGMKKLQSDINKLDSGLAYVAEKSGNNWRLPSGKTAQIGDYVVLNGTMGKATAVLTGGSTNIVAGTNWAAVTDGALNAITNQIGTLNGKINSQIITGNIGNSASKSFDFDWHNSLAVIFIGRGYGNRAGLYYVDGDGGIVTVSTCTDVTVTYSNNAFTISNSGATIYYRIINY